MSWRSLRVVAFDTETTGLEPFGGDRVIEIAMVTLEVGPDGAGRVVDRFARLVNPERDIPRKVTEITGISDRDVASAPAFADIAGEVRERLRDAITVAHNYPFDLGFLTREFDLVRSTRGDPSMVWPEPFAEIDTVDVSMKVWADAKSHKLADLVERCGVTLGRAHRATDDATATGLCFLEMARRAHVEDELQALLDWADAVGRPPEDGPFSRDPHGRVVLRGGPHDGQPVGDHPVHLAWMEKARRRTARGWQYTYPDSVRRWARRWLEVRGSGRAQASQKGVSADAWQLDPCIATPRNVSLRERPGLGG